MCTRCGCRGTVARLILRSPPAIERYCRDCWPLVRDALAERPVQEYVSRAWSDVERLLSLLPPTTEAATVTALAAEIVATAWDMDGPVPPIVQEFLLRTERGPA